MAIEKAFAINAPPEAIWRALMQELAEGEPNSFEIERSEPNERLTLRVQVGAFPAWITYRLIPKEGHTEVVAVLQPSGFRYVLYQIITLGRGNTGFEMALVQGLANLKAAVEGDSGRKEHEGGEGSQV